jgi:hypothetical protein
MTQALTPNARELWQKPSFENFPLTHLALANQVPEAQVPRTKSPAPRFQYHQGSHELRCLLRTAFASILTSISSSTMRG